MRISVLVTAYNLEKYLEACLDSVLQQTQPADEVVIVDDGSTDGTAQIARRYSESRSTWHYFRPEQNLGVLRATLFGLERTTGDVICFLDGDDRWRADKIKCVSSRFEQNSELLLLSHAYVTIDSSGRVLQERFWDLQYMQRLLNKCPEQVDGEMRRAILTYFGLVWLGSAWCLRRSFLKLGEFARLVEQLPNARLTYQDHLLAVHTVLNCRGVCGWLPQALLEYRLHGANTSGDTSSLERARLMVTKGMVTRQATLALVEQHLGSSDPIAAIQRLRVREVQFMDELYAGRLWRALKHFGVCFWKLWRWEARLKETIRLLACVFFGPGGFIAWKRRFRRNT